MSNALKLLEERVARSVSVWPITSETVSKTEDFTPMETSDASGKIVLELLDEQYPSKMKVVIPSQQKEVRCTHTKKVLFEAGVESNLQFFISPTNSLESKLCYPQLMAFLTESLSEEEEHESLKVLTFQVFGEEKFVLSIDVFLCLVRLKRYVYNEREFWLLVELQKELMFDWGKLTVTEQLNYIQNCDWFLLRTVSESNNELFKKKMVDCITSITEASRVINGK